MITMAEQKKYSKLTYEEAMVAHMYCCPYYSPDMDRDGNINPQSVLEKLTRKGKKVKITYDSPKPVCGANRTQCDGTCWYLKHFSEILTQLQESKA